jgi:hypothetical protein
MIGRSATGVAGPMAQAVVDAAREAEGEAPCD